MNEKVSYHFRKPLDVLCSRLSCVCDDWCLKWTQKYRLVRNTQLHCSVYSAVVSIDWTTFQIDLHEITWSEKLLPLSKLIYMQPRYLDIILLKEDSRVFAVRFDWMKFCLKHKLFLVQCLRVGLQGAQTLLYLTAVNCEKQQQLKFTVQHKYVVEVKDCLQLWWAEHEVFGSCLSWPKHVLRFVEQNQVSGLWGETLDHLWCEHVYSFNRKCLLFVCSCGCFCTYFINWRVEVEVHCIGLWLFNVSSRLFPCLYIKWNFTDNVISH